MALACAALNTQGTPTATDQTDTNDPETCDPETRDPTTCDPETCRHGSSAERIYRICLNILVWFCISAQAVFSSCLEHLYILFLISNFLAAADGAKDKKSKSNLFSLRLLLEKVCMGL